MEDEDYDMQDDQPLDDEEDDDIESFSSSSSSSSSDDEGDTSDEDEALSSDDEDTDKPSKAPPPPTTLPRAAKPLISKYEWAMFIGVRAAQLERGAPTTLLDPKSYENFDVRRIAQAELEQGLCPLSLIRTLPNGQKYIISAKSAVPPKL